MASPSITANLSQLEDPSTLQANKATGYGDVLRQVTSPSEASALVPNLEAFVDSVLGDSLGIVAARPLLGSAVEAVKSLKSAENQILVGTHILQALQSRVVSFEEQDAAIRELTADAYQTQEDWIESAKVLQGINLESSQCKIADESKVAIFMRICRLYLEEDDTTTAESYLNRAKNLIYKVKDASLNLQFQLSQARILDSRRKFLDASSSYHSISFSPAVAEEERVRCLSCAITCAVLAPAGPRRSRALAKLYKDERAPEVLEFGILEKMFLDRLLSTEEVDRFSSNLLPHQLAKTGDGTTVLAKAVVEHNLLSASRLYANIRIAGLGTLLGCDAGRAEEYASAMLEQRRVSGRIDQINGIIFFDNNVTTESKTKHGQVHNGAGRDLRKWDARVQGVTEELERVASMLQSQYPVSIGPFNSMMPAADIPQDFAGGDVVH